MAEDPCLLLQESIESLERLSAVFTEELEASPAVTPSLPTQTRLSKEALLTMSILLPKLHAAQQWRTSARAWDEQRANCKE
jgi:hypothetical protein